MTNDKPKTAQEWAEYYHKFNPIRNDRGERISMGQEEYNLEQMFDQAMAQAREPLEKEIERLAGEVLKGNSFRFELEAELARIKSAAEILTIDGKVWIPAENIEHARNLALEEAAKECDRICKIYGNYRGVFECAQSIRALKAKPNTTNKP